MKDKLQQIDRNQREILKLRPLHKPELRQLRDYYRIGLTYSSNAIEGNTLSESETKVVIEDGLTVGGKTVREHQEAVGHAKAFEAIWGMRSRKTITENDLLELHRLFYAAIDPQTAGIYRSIRVLISGSRYACPPPKQVPALVGRFFREMRKAHERLHPVCFSAWLHKELVFIHPFVDGNGRIARLLMNLALLQQGYLVTIVPPVLRRDYYVALEKAHEDETVFFRFVIGCHIEAQKEYLRLLN